MTAKTLIPRRDFLGASGVLTGLIAAGSPLALLAPSRAWAIDLKVLTSTEGAALMAVARTIAPHDKLDDAAYALVIQSIDTDAAKDPQLLGMLRGGIRQLGPAFASAAEPARVQSLKAIEAGPFFQTMRVKTLGTLYATPIAYAYFGYEGEAFSKGGYLLRGFNDLRWLPDVPPADSGPVPGA
ncbi:MAG TPA: twin-arginine translocation signal domain-containing protein [Steroidobacteraceae bacterium]